MRYYEINENQMDLFGDDNFNYYSFAKRLWSWADYIEKQGGTKFLKTDETLPKPMKKFFYDVYVSLKPSNISKNNKYYKVPLWKDPLEMAYYMGENPNNEDQRTYRQAYQALSHTGQY